MKTFEYSRTVAGLLAAVIVTQSAIAANRQTENVILISVDGLRWQEVFNGADRALMNHANGVDDTNRLEKKFWRDNIDTRREALMPFFWSVIAKKGQLYGNQNKGSVARLTNGLKFTYPGFNEILTGFADPRIDKNEKRDNPNVTVLEWLFRKPEFTNRVAAIANWDVFPYILNTRRSGIPMWTGYETNSIAKPGSRMELVEQLFRETTSLWPDMNFDSFYLHAAIEYVKEYKPRVVWIAFSETDEWAHEGQYDQYLGAAHNMDAYVRTLWDTLQSMPEYRGKTTLILTCDHGRGGGSPDWKNHGADVEGAENIWLAVLGPDTLAALLGQDYHAAVPKSGAPILEVFPAPKIAK
jgi:hypothetical protein